jgi:hypothetical protein
MPDDIAHTVYRVIKYGVIIGSIVGFSILLIGSLLVYDIGYIQKNPKFFISETLVMGILTALPVIFICYLRGVPHVDTMKDFMIIFLKIVILHVGFQLSGVYSALFPMSASIK